MDNRWMSGKNEKIVLSKVLPELRAVAVSVNADYAKQIGIEQSTAITCVKPSGTVSQLVNSASGIHARYAPYYIRRVRGGLTDPLTRFLSDAGVPNEVDVTNPDIVVFDFPQEAPTDATVTDDMTALDQLELWLAYQEFWCEHKPSVTVSVAEDEWMSVGAWVYDHFDQVSGISFLPKSDHTYRQAPYERITSLEYATLCNASPMKIDWSRLSEYELEDNTDASQTLACSADGCEVVDISAA
jgi:ribonucleoside-diphosphate reductase alpha chain